MKAFLFIQKKYFNHITFVVMLLALGLSLSAQDAMYYKNANFIKMLNRDSSYVKLKRRVTSEFLHARPGKWGEFIKGVDEELITQKKYIAFTFDGCGGPHRNGYDAELVDYLKKENVPATFFVTGLWIDANFKTFLQLSKDTLFEIENHGLYHRPCSMDGESKYGVHGTANASQAFDELEANARKIQDLTHRRPIYYRSATAFIDESGVRMASMLGITPISFEVLSGDAVPYTPTSVIVESVMKDIRPGAIVIMHFNHPEWNTCEALQIIIPELRKKGYSFVKLDEFRLRSDQK